MMSSLKGTNTLDTYNTETLVAGCAVGISACFASPIGGSCCNLQIKPPTCNFIQLQEFFTALKQRLHISLCEITGEVFLQLFVLLLYFVYMLSGPMKVTPLQPYLLQISLQTSHLIRRNYLFSLWLGKYNLFEDFNYFSLLIWGLLQSNLWLFEFFMGLVIPTIFNFYQNEQNCYKNHSSQVSSLFIGLYSKNVR